MSASSPPPAPSSRYAVIVGVAQLRNRPGLDGEWHPIDPVSMMGDTLRRAADDAAQRSVSNITAGEILGSVEVVAAVDPLAWQYDALCAGVAAAAGAPPGCEGMTFPPGGNSPGDLLGRLANRIVDGEIRVALLAGSEAVYSRRRAMKSEVNLPWPPYEGHRDFLKGQRPLTTDLETRHGITAPVHCYPLYENAIRARSGRTIAEHQRFLAELMSRNAAVAATNPVAWFPTAWSPEQIETVDADNRWVCFPYPKRMNAIMEVDMAAGCVVMASDEADRLGIPASQRVAVLGGASASDSWAVTERPSLTSSPAIASAAKAALEHAAIASSLEAIDRFDFYSCFPSAVQMAAEALGMRTDDPRGLTVTGGLAYAGGPGNSYSMHSMCVLTDLIRDGHAKTGLVTSLGMTATKHAVTVLSGDPKAIAAADGRWTKVEMAAADITGPVLTDAAMEKSEATVESYTVEFDRAGSAVRTMFVLRLPDGRRTVANGPCTEEEVRVLTKTEPIGKSGRLVGGDAAAGFPNEFVLASA